MNVRLLLMCFSILGLTACSPGPAENTEKLASFVESRDFGAPVVFMEMRGSFFIENWYKVTLYFGYSYDENWTTCMEDAERWSNQPGAGSFRCVVVE